MIESHYSFRKKVVKFPFLSLPGILHNSREHFASMLHWHYSPFFLHPSNSSKLVKIPAMVSFKKKQFDTQEVIDLLFWIQYIVFCFKLLYRMTLSMVDLFSKYIIWYYCFILYLFSLNNSHNEYRKNSHLSSFTCTCWF